MGSIERNKSSQLQAYPMKGGDGDSSYTNNSSYQVSDEEVVKIISDIYVNKILAGFLKAQTEEVVPSVGLGKIEDGKRIKGLPHIAKPETKHAAERLTIGIWVGVEVVFKGHLEDEIIDELFDSYCKRLEQVPSLFSSGGAAILFFLDKFKGVDVRRWQKKMHFLLSSMSVVYVLTTPIPKDGGDDATVEQIRKRAKRTRHLKRLQVESCNKPYGSGTKDDKLHFVEEPVEIMDREVKQLRRSRVPIVKVRWNSRRGPEFTWEREDQFRKKYPHLFTKTAPSSSAVS
ncbi:hypothetical protein Tco_0210636 [Tanacetum coccineum]